MLAVAVAGCAGKRIEHGVFYSPKGYRVALPPGDWSVRGDSRADLELRHRTEPVGMLANASCGGEVPKASLEVLARHLLIGLRDRSVVVSERVPLDGKVARHAVLEGRLGERGDPVKLELYVMRNDRCVYDFLYVAPASSFDAWQSSFHRFVDTFAAE